MTQLASLCSYDEIQRRLDEGYPKLVADDFPGMTGKVTAALTYRGILELIVYISLMLSLQMLIIRY